MSSSGFLVLLLSLPREIWIDILNTWIGHTKSISALDIAVSRLYRVPYISLLRNLELPFLQCSGKHMDKFIQWISHRKIKLKSLSIHTKLVLDVFPISDISLHHLEHMFISHIQSHLPLQLPQLNHLFSSCSTLRSISFSSLTEMRSGDFRLLVRSLSHVPLTTLSIDTLPKTSTDAEMKLIAKTWSSSLNTLSCKDFALSRQNMTDICTRCTLLHTLKLSFSDRYTNPSQGDLVYFFKQLPKLKVLSLRDNCTLTTVLDDAVIRSIVDALPYLVSLDLPVGRNVSYKVFSILKTRPLAYLSKGSYIYTYDDYARVSIDNSLSDIQTVLQSLSIEHKVGIEIRCSFPVSNPLCKWIAEYCGSRLVEFSAELADDAHQCDSLLHLLLNCPSLHTLHLHSCHGLSMQSIEQIRHFCPGLKKISLTNHDGLTDSTLCVLVKNYKSQLVHINVSGCSLVSDESLTPISSCCANLEHLDVIGTQISWSALTNFLNRRGRKKCKVKVSPGLRSSLLTLRRRSSSIRLVLLID
ncbi:hypothetical protein EON65_39835 [archaeon]|nr:MAG: hypothetical protein EON65_39835 [archaeon]